MQMDDMRKTIEEVNNIRQQACEQHQCLIETKNLRASDLMRFALVSDEQLECSYRGRNEH